MRKETEIYLFTNKLESLEVNKRQKQVINCHSHIVVVIKVFRKFYFYNQLMRKIIEKQLIFIFLDIFIIFILFNT